MSTTTLVIAHVASSKFTLGTETTGGTVTIPASTLSGDDLLVFIGSRNHDSTTASPTCVDNDSGGNTFALQVSTSLRKAHLYWKKATNNSAGKTITVAGCVSSAVATCSAYRNCYTGGNPITPLGVSANTGSNPQVAGFTPTYGDSMIGFTAFNYAGIASASTYSAGTTSLTSIIACQSTGGSDCELDHVAVLQSGGPNSTGTFQWTQVSSAEVSIRFALRPATVTSSSVTTVSSTTKNPVVTYAAAGTYTVRLTVTDNDGNSSTTSGPVTVS